MKNFYLYNTCFFNFLVLTYAAGRIKPGCLEKEKAITLLETAENFLLKLRDSYPFCEKELNSTDQSECGPSKPLAYIELTKKLISDVRQNFPSCPKDIVQYKPRDCSVISEIGHRESGVYTIWPSETDTAGKPLQVFCDMKTDDGGWTVIQRRGKFPIQQDFYKDWESYKQGFGNITEEFWLGNENIRVLCHEGCKIRFDLQDENGEHGFAVYETFNLTSSNYSIYIDEYTGNVGDGMQYHNNNKFSTKDKHGIGKAKRFEGGWWYNLINNSLFCNLNGVYQPGNYSSQTVSWWKWRGFNNLGSVEIKVKPK